MNSKYPPQSEIKDKFINTNIDLLNLHAYIYMSYCKRKHTKGIALLSGMMYIFHSLNISQFKHLKCILSNRCCATLSVYLNKHR